MHNNRATANWQLNWLALQNFTVYVVFIQLNNHFICAQLTEERKKRTDVEENGEDDTGENIAENANDDGGENVAENVEDDVRENIDDDVQLAPDVTMDELRSLETEVDDLKNTVKRLKSEINKWTLTEETFKDDDKKFNHFIGLPSLTLGKLIQSYIDDSLSRIRVTSLSNFQKLLLTLMKL